VIAYSLVRIIAVRKHIHRDFISAAQRYKEAQKSTEALPVGVNGLPTLAQRQDQVDKSPDHMDPTGIQSFTACGVSRDTIDVAPLSAPEAQPPSPPSVYASPGFCSAVLKEDDPTGYKDWISPSSSSSSLLDELLLKKRSLKAAGVHGEAEGSLAKQNPLLYLLQEKLQMKEEMLADISLYIQSKREALQIQIEHLEKQAVPLENAGNDQPQDRFVTRASAGGTYQVVGTLCHLDIAATACNTVRTREIGIDEIETRAEILTSSPAACVRFR
jgi:hypothetical protein